MNAIFKVNNVYVPVKYKEPREGIEVEKAEDLIVYIGGSSAQLYGGRVYIFDSQGMLYFEIDGIPIRDISLYTDGRINVERKFDTVRIAAYLNQIENLGLETFLENYKKQLENLRDKLEELSEEMQQNSGNEGANTRLNAINSSIIQITSFLFPLYINMNTGIEMQDYIDAYNTIINMYF